MSEQRMTEEQRRVASENLARRKQALRQKKAKKRKAMIRLILIGLILLLLLTGLMIHLVKGRHTDKADNSKASEENVGTDNNSETAYNKFYIQESISDTKYATITEAEGGTELVGNYSRY